MGLEIWPGLLSMTHFLIEMPIKTLPRNDGELCQTSMCQCHSDFVKFLNEIYRFIRNFVDSILEILGRLLYFGFYESDIDFSASLTRLGGGVRRDDRPCIGLTHDVTSICGKEQNDQSTGIVRLQDRNSQFGVSMFR